MAYLTSVLLTLAVIAMTTPTPTLSDSPGMAQCSASLLLLAPCMPFVQGVGPMPTDQCCNGLTTLVRDQPSCICSVLGSSASLPVNRSLVLQLPDLCQVNIASTVYTTCPGIAVPPPAPSESPQTSKPTSCSCTASEPAPMQSALVPLKRARDQLMGQNKGAKMMPRITLSFYIIVLALVLAL